MEGDDLHELVKSDPERAWPMVLALLRIHPDWVEAAHLMEDFVYEHDERFIDRIEAAALADPIVRDIVDQAYVGGFASVGAERLHRLQDRLRRGGDF